MVEKENRLSVFQVGLGFTIDGLFAPKTNFNPDGYLFEFGGHELYELVQLFEVPHHERCVVEKCVNRRVSKSFADGLTQSRAWSMKP